VLVAALLTKGDFDSAADEAERILERWPDEKRGPYNLARARAGQGRFDEAEQFRAAIELAPHPIAAYHDRPGVAFAG
jgi:tetratricopeptide (TPR) repeat protein